MNILLQLYLKRYNTKFEPDYYGVEITTDDWIEYPWEINNDN